MQRQLIREVWGPEREDDSRSLPWYQNLRGKLEPDPREPRYLITETGLGYRLRPDDIGRRTALETKPMSAEIASKRSRQLTQG